MPILTHPSHLYFLLYRPQNYIFRFVRHYRHTINDQPTTHRTMPPPERLTGDPDEDPEDLSDAPFAFGRLPTGRERHPEYTLSSSPSQRQPRSNRAGPARPTPATCHPEQAAHEGLQQIPYNYPALNAQPGGELPRYVPSALEYLQASQYRTRDNPRATNGDDFIPPSRRNSSPVSGLTPAPIDEPESIDGLAAARAGSPPTLAGRIPQQPPAAASRTLLFFGKEVWRLVRLEYLGLPLPAALAAEDYDTVLRLTNVLRDFVESENMREPQNE